MSKDRVSRNQKCEGKKEGKIRDGGKEEGIHGKERKGVREGRTVEKRCELWWLLPFLITEVT